MMAIGLLALVLSGQPAEPVAELTYVVAAGQRETALRVDADGTATVQLRGETLSANLGAEVAEKLRSRFLQYDLLSVSQREFDSRLAGSARAAGLTLPIPHADECEIRIGPNCLTCRGSAILSTRITNQDELTQFEKLRTDLEQIRSIVILGGPTEFGRYLATGRTALGQPLGLSDLVYADDFAGERVAHFRPGGEHGPLLIVSSTGGERPVARVFEMTAP